MPSATHVCCDIQSTSITNNIGKGQGCDIPKNTLIGAKRYSGTSYRLSFTADPQSVYATELYKAWWLRYFLWECFLIQ